MGWDSSRNHTNLASVFLLPVFALQFKSFSQRVSEIEVDVFRSLDPVKAEPSEGSSFFRDCLLEWRVRFRFVLAGFAR